MAADQAACKCSVVVGPVSIPEIVNVPQIVVNTGPNQVRLDEFNPKRSALHGAALRDAELSARMDFSVADAADDGVLNLILWHATMGYKTPYPRSNERESLGKD